MRPRFHCRHTSANAVACPLKDRFAGLCHRIGRRHPAMTGQWQVTAFRKITGNAIKTARPKLHIAPRDRIGGLRRIFFWTLRR